MSGAHSEDVTVAAEEVTVRKSVDVDNFQTLAVVFDVSWDRGETGRLQLLDHVPDDLSLDDIGFHPDYDADHWSVENDRVVFEREFEPGEEYTTIYGIRDYDEEETEALMTEPEVDVFSPEEAEEGGIVGGAEGENGGVAEIEGIAPDERSEAVRDLIAGESESLPGLGEEATPGADEPAGGEAAEAAEAEASETAEADAAESADAVATAGDDETPEAAAGTPGSGSAAAGGEGGEGGGQAEATVETSESGEITVPITGGVARVLVKELREGTVSNEDRRLLREELLPGEGSTEARIKHLQSRVSDLEAYSEALEAFLDEEGTGQQVLDELSTETEALSDEIGGLDRRLGSTEDRLEMLDGTLADVEDDLDDLDDAVSDVEDDLDDEVGGLRDDFEDRLADVGDDLDDLRDEVEEIAAFRDRLSSVFGAGGPGAAAATATDDAGESEDGEDHADEEDDG